MPLAVVTPTLDAAVLAALAATTARTSGAQVHRMAAAGSPDGVRRVLARLVDQGIVLAEEHPSATFYLLNREHVAAEAILALTRVRTTIIERITDALSVWSPAPVHASLFGSFARAEATSTSDIDILAAIAAADAICGLRLGRYNRSQDHNQAAALLETVDLPDTTLATKLRRVLASKDNAHYSPRLISKTDAQGIVRQA